MGIYQLKLIPPMGIINLTSPVVSNGIVTPDKISNLYLDSGFDIVSINQ